MLSLVYEKLCGTTWSPTERGGAVAAATAHFFRMACAEGAVSEVILWSEGRAQGSEHAMRRNVSPEKGFIHHLRVYGLKGPAATPPTFSRKLLACSQPFRSWCSPLDGGRVDWRPFLRRSRAGALPPQPSP